MAENVIKCLKLFSFGIYLTKNKKKKLPSKPNAESILS